MTNSIAVYHLADLVIARNMLRRKVFEYGSWSPMFHMRASAALTALVETILYSRTSGYLDVDIVENGSNRAVKLTCVIDNTAQKPLTFDKLRRQVSMLTDDFDLCDNSPCYEITITIWA
jgi:hypothetical protein